MHPAYSVILFTCASGAGYGLLFWLGVWSLTGVTTFYPMFFGGALIVALALITIGLVSSTFHLGRPERVWRALSQWRTSWLSREGVAAIATFVPAGVLGLQWVLDLDVGPEARAIAAVLAAAGAVTTVWCTGMIYGSLPTIRAWSHPLVAPLYLALGLATGGLLTAALMALFGLAPQRAVLFTLPMLAVAWIMKGAYWSAIDEGQSVHTLATATGLGMRDGVPVTVRTLDPPHTQANYVMREMGFSIARRHAAKLRRLAMLALFLVPSLILLALLRLGPSPFDLPLSLVAVLSATSGVLAERWLFFAEARHVAMLYYGADGA